MFDEEESSNEGGGMLRWLITYADLITLLLAFFIILYAMDRTQQVRFSLLSQALARNFDSHSIVGQSPGPSIVTGASGVKTPVVHQADLQRLSQLQRELQRAVDQQGLQHQVSIHSDVRGVVMRLDATMLFGSASAALRPQAQHLLQSVGKVLESVPNLVEVSGYTDSTPIRTAQYPSNWQLSAMRAANVVYVLSRVPKFSPGRLSVAAFGKYVEVASNATAVGRQKNRRVEILVLRQSLRPLAVKLRS